MKKVMLLTILIVSFLQINAIDKSKWKLIWRDEFNKKSVDTTKWTQAKRSHPDWCKYLTDDSRCTIIDDGKLYLRGIVNDNKEKDPVEYLTGALISENKFTFKHGKIEIRAKLECAQGAWPALWLLGASGGWPHNGEIDIMEHLSHDSIFYQTVHSDYTLNKGGANNPPQGGTAPIDVSDYNIFSVELYKDKILFFINDKVTFEYKKLIPEVEGQWPFDNDFYILLSQQLEGSWVGKASPEQLPVQMIIDYVRVYEPK